MELCRGHNRKDLKRISLIYGGTLSELPEWQLRRHQSFLDYIKKISLGADVFEIKNDKALRINYSESDFKFDKYACVSQGA